VSRLSITAWSLFFEGAAGLRRPGGSNVLSPRVGQSTYCTKPVRQEDRETWLKSPVIAMNASGCWVCILATAPCMTPHAAVGVALVECKQ